MANQQHPSNVEPLPFSPEEMKAIGEIELGPSRHEKFLNAHYKKLIVVSIIFMLVAASCIIYATWRARQEDDGAATMIAALKATSVGDVVEASAYDTAALEKVGTDYPGTNAAATSELLHGMQLIAGGQEQQGVEVLENVIAANPPENFLRVRAQAYLATHYMSGGDAEKAKKLWQEVSSSKTSPYLALSYLSLGDLAKEAGDIEQARAFYNMVQKECPFSPLMVTVQQRLLILGVDAPEPVAPAPAEKDTATEESPAESWGSGNISTGLLQQ